MDQVCGDMGLAFIDDDVHSPRSDENLKERTNTNEHYTTFSEILQRESKQKKLSAKIRLRLILITVVVLWLLIGTIFYSLNEDWPWYTGLFFAVNVGLGVGYGENMLQYPSSWGFTIIFVIVGSSFCTAGLVMLFQFVVELRDTKLDTISAHTAGGSSKEDLLKQSFGKLGYMMRKRKGRIMLFTLWGLWVLFGMIIFRYGGDSDDGNLLACNHTADIGPHDFCHSVLYTLMFCITSMSTAAQAIPKPKEYPLLLTTVWIWVGIPLYAAVCATVADVLVNHYTRVQDRNEFANSTVTNLDLYRMQQLSMRERTSSVSSVGSLAGEHRASELLAENSGSSIHALLQKVTDVNVIPDENMGVDYGSFLEYQLRSMRVCDRKMLDMLRRAFAKLATEDGCFYPRDLRRARRTETLELGSLEGSMNESEMDHISPELDAYNPPSLQMQQMEIESPRRTGFMVTPRETRMADATPRDPHHSNHSRLTSQF